MMSAPLILASASRVRAALLQGAGLTFSIEPAKLDETELKNQASADGAILNGAALAVFLAKKKAEEVSARHPEALVIGADQTLSCHGRLFDKPADQDEARQNLLFFRAHPHHLHSGVALMKDGECLWSHHQQATLTMRPFSDGFLESYLEQLGDKVLTSVGAYQLEGPGVQLFKKIDGDYFTILGLPLLELLDALRAQKAVQT